MSKHYHQQEDDAMRSRRTKRKQVDGERERPPAQAEQERQRAEEMARTLEREQDTLQAITENAPTHLAYLDPQFNFVRVNSAYAQGSGHSKEELTGRNHFEFFPDPENQAIFERVRDTGQPVEFHAKPFEYPGQPWRGTTYWDWTLTPVKDEAGRVQGLVLSLVDVTKRVRAEQERERLLKEVDAQRHLFQTVVENAPVGIALLRGPTFVFELANPAYEAIAPGKVLLGRTVAEAWPELASQVLPILERVFHTGEPYRAVDAPLPVQRTPGAPLEEAHFTFAYVPLRDPKGLGDAILVLVIETTEQVRARERTEELAEAAQRKSAELQGVIDNMVDGVFVSDTEGRITLTNEAGGRLLGTERLEEVKRAIVELPELLHIRHLDGRAVKPEELPIARALMGETIVLDDKIIFNPRTQRDIYVRTNAAPIKDEKGTIVGAVEVARDVTEMMELDRLKDQFINVAAHELKTPVTSIKGYAQVLLQREHEGLTSRGVRALQAINRQADKISSLVNDLLDISRLQAGQLELGVEKIDLPVLIQEVVDRMALTTTIHHIRVIRADPVVVRGDRDRLEEVLINLIDNAIKFSPKGGNIDLAVTVGDRQAVVSVRDYGVGIPKDRQARIFERFYRAHTGTPYDYGGMGVGLYISREIVARHGGRMWFESKEGKGSTFYFSLPLA